MATTQKYPTVLAESGAGNTWQNLQNAAGTPGGSNATLLADGAAKQVDLTSASLAFAIPAGATINGIVVDVTASEVSEVGFDLSAILKKSGSTTETKTQTTLYSAASFGSATDKWSANWTATDINSNMTLALQFTLGVGAAAFFTFAGVGVTVYYTGGVAKRLLKLEDLNGDDE